MAELERAYLRHAVPGRLRFEIPARKRSSAYFDDLRERFTQWNRIAEVRVQPLTGSLILETEDGTDLAEIAEYAKSNDLFEMAPQQPARHRAETHERAHAGPNLPVAARLMGGLESADERLKQVSKGQVDLMGLAFFAFLAATLVQTRRGNLIGPALPMFWSAMQLGMSIRADAVQREVHAMFEP